MFLQCFVVWLRSSSIAKKFSLLWLESLMFSRCLRKGRHSFTHNITTSLIHFTTSVLYSTRRCKVLSVVHGTVLWGLWNISLNSSNLEMLVSWTEELCNVLQLSPQFYTIYWNLEFAYTCFLCFLKIKRMASKIECPNTYYTVRKDISWSSCDWTISCGQVIIFVEIQNFYQAWNDYPWDWCAGCHQK